MAASLREDQLHCSCGLETFTFETTAELEPHSRIIGQPRGTKAILFGIEMDSPGYNIYVMGESGTGRTTAIKKFIERRAKDSPVPSDWAYVHNFHEPHKPRVLRLAPGDGIKLRDGMEGVIEELRTRLPRAFEAEEFRNATHKIEEDLNTGRERLFSELQSKAREVGAAVVGSPTGIQIVPAKDGEPLPPEEIANLSEETRKAWREAVRSLEREMEEGLGRSRDLERKAHDDLSALVGKVADVEIRLALDDLRQLFAENTEVTEYLGLVSEDIREQIGLFRGPAKQDEKRPEAIEKLQFRRYEVNLIVDHSRSQGAPVVVEYNPTVLRLLGRVEHEPRLGGGAVTDFTLMRGGALQAANGGYLVVRAKDLFSEPGAWEALKRALVGGSVCPDDPAVRGGAPTRSLDPETIPLNLKVILIGPPFAYHLLHLEDEDFRTLFKVMADFDERMERTPENELEYATFVANVCHEEELRPFDRGGVARVVEYGSRQAGSQSKMSTRFGDIADLLRESNYWAGQAKLEVVTSNEVRQAIQERIKRRNRVEVLHREQILKNRLLIATEGEVVGQINGLSVAAAGVYEFGQPTRVTARTFMGKEGVVQIDREVELAGPIHNKGVMTLVGYLGGQYAEDHPLSLSAQITFEQNYGGIEGDSASSTELYSLLSSLSSIPIKQSVAVTGSVNQRGEIQAIGGVTEKVEGWFDLCQERGLTGTQGAMIPASNVEDLMLKEEVVEAVVEGKFSIWSVSTVDEGIEVLTGRPAPEVHAASKERLSVLAKGMRDLGEEDED